MPFAGRPVFLSAVAAAKGEPRRSPRFTAAFGEPCHRRGEAGWREDSAKVRGGDEYNKLPPARLRRGERDVRPHRQALKMPGG